MIYEPFEPKQRFAVRRHAGNDLAPDGWPAEANPLSPGAKAPDGYEELSGAALNAIREKLRPKFFDMCERRRVALEAAARAKSEDAVTAANIAGGFQWNGDTFSCSVAAQLNCLHDEAAGEFPVERSTVDGKIVSLRADEFTGFCAAMREAIRASLVAGNAAKRALAGAAR